MIRPAASGIVSRHAPRFALAFMVMFAHAPAGRAALRQTQTGSHTHHRNAAHRGGRRGAAAQSLGDKVVAYAAPLQGRQVGDGECFSLAYAALLNAGARTAYAYGEITPDADYVWGRPVSLAQLQPGDILQFRNFRIVKRVTMTLQVAGGFARDQSSEIEERDHHTAIVEQTLGDSVSILEQNVDPAGRVVQRNRIALTNHVETETNVADASQVTTEFTVEGDVRAYRPEKASRAELADAEAMMPGLGSATMARRN